MGNGPTAEELFDRGVRLLESGHAGDALRNLEMCRSIDPYSARCLSYLGAALAIAEKRIREGEKLCRIAIEREFYQTDFYWNLGRVYLAGGYKDQAVRAFRKGLEMDGSHSGMRDALSRLGWRRRPLLAFLPRSHALNRGLGLIRAWFFSGT
jgi:tetratricopeptide (TPR) repeat protein